MRSRIVALAVAITAVAGLLTAGQLAAPAWACACGGIALPPGAADAVSQETSIVSHDGGRETIEMHLTMRGAGSRAGLVVPTPSAAEVTAGSVDDFTAMQAAAAPRIVSTDDWWSVDPSAFPGAPAPVAGAAPTVIDRVRLGPLEATTLAADDPAGLRDWLADNGFAMSDAVLGQLGGYVERHWDFVALKLTGAAPLDGQLDPIRMTFASDELVYPMAMSRAATDVQSVKLYVLDDHRVDAAFLGGGSARASTEWSGPAPAVAGFPGGRLTVLSLFFAHPSSEIDGDLRLPAAESDARVEIVDHEVRHITVLGFPVGWLLVLLGALLVIAAVVAILLRRRRAYP
jgi:hypothetical protein